MKEQSKKLIAILIILLQLIPGAAVLILERQPWMVDYTAVYAFLIPGIWILSILLARKIHLLSSRYRRLAVFIPLIYLLYLAIICRSFVLFALYVR